jgi:acetyl-CoA C-acetyltransferase
MADTDPVIIGGARTPIGRLLGSLAGFSGADLGSLAIKAAIERAGISASDVEYVIMGQVLQAGAGQIASRQAAVKAGIPMTTPAMTLNKVCLSGLDAIAQAADLIRLGEYDIVVAGGMESMTNAPHLLAKSRKGFKFGTIEMIDAMAYDGLTDPFDGMSMGESTERYNAKFGISRAEQDEFAARSQQRAALAQKNGVLAEEIIAVQVPQRGKDPLTFADDEGIRVGTTAEALSKLSPAFGKEGTITAGSSSQISDGAAAVIVTSREKAEQLGASILAEVGRFGTVAGPDNSLHSQPANAIKKALARASRQGRALSVADLDLIEINEAFASVAVQSMRELEAGPEKVNVNGGAIALGHPLGASGTRIALTLAYELRRRGGGLGAAGLCGGGGQGSALLLKVPS